MLQKPSGTLILSAVEYFWWLISHISVCFSHDLRRQLVCCVGIHCGDTTSVVRRDFFLLGILRSTGGCASALDFAFKQSLRWLGGTGCFVSPQRAELKSGLAAVVLPDPLYRLIELLLRSQGSSFDEVVSWFGPYFGHTKLIQINNAVNNDHRKL